MESNDTFGELIAEIFSTYRELYRDDELPAVATAATLNDFFYRAESDRRRREGGRR